MTNDLREKVAEAIAEAHRLQGRSYYSMADAALAVIEKERAPANEEAE